MESNYLASAWVNTYRVADQYNMHLAQFQNALERFPDVIFVLLCGIIKFDYIYLEIDESNLFRIKNNSNEMKQIQAILKTLLALCSILIGIHVDCQIILFDSTPTSIQCGNSLTPPYVTATSPCGAVAITYTVTENLVDCNGYYTIVVTATDGCGATEVQTRIIAAYDTEDPVFLTQLQDVTLACGAEYIGPPLLYVDNCTTNLTYDVAQVSIYDNDVLISTVIIHTIIDLCGNATTATQTITYNCLPPEITEFHIYFLPPIFLDIWEFTIENEFSNYFQEFAVNMQGVDPVINTLSFEPFTQYTLSTEGFANVNWNGSTLIFSNSAWDWSFEATLMPGGPSEITFTTGGIGCMDVAACNYNPLATIEDDACVYSGCTDSDAINFDANAGCDDGSCYFIANDEKTGAIPLSLNALGICAVNVTASLSAATVSIGAQSVAATGEDIWYSFVATEPGVSIKINSVYNNISIELQNAAGSMLDAENLLNGLSQEVLNYGHLQIGNTYYIAVRNFNSLQGEGEFTICLQALPDSKCGSDQNASFVPCSRFKASWIGTPFYKFVFTSSTTGIPYSSASGAGRILISDAIGIVPNDSYSVNVFAVYVITNGMGIGEQVFISSANPCVIYLQANPLLSMRPSENCTNAGALQPYRMLRAQPTICGVTNFKWEFTNQNGIQSTIAHYTSTSVVVLNTVPGILMGNAYDVRIKPVYADGSAGAFGISQCISMVSTSSVQYFGDEANEEDIMEVSNEIAVAFYPNPFDGHTLYLNVINASEVFIPIDIYDVAGQLMFSKLIEKEDDNRAVIQFENPLPAGAYFVNLKLKNESIIKKLIVR